MTRPIPTVSAAAIASDPGDGNCPTCELSGTTPERALEVAPRYMTALLSADFSGLDPYTPDEPAACCWDCRRMIAVGLDPAALVAQDVSVGTAVRS